MSDNETAEEVQTVGLQPAAENEQLSGGHSNDKHQLTSAHSTKSDESTQKHDKDEPQLLSAIECKKSSESCAGEQTDLSATSDDDCCTGTKESIKVKESIREQTVETTTPPVISESNLVEHSTLKCPDNQKDGINKNCPKISAESSIETVAVHSSVEIPAPIECAGKVLKQSSTAIDVPKQSSKEAEESPTESEPPQSDGEYAEHVTYSDDGTAIYTDPKTQYKYKWCEAKNNWVSFEEETTATANGDSSQKSNPYENEHYRWCTESNQWIPKTSAPDSSQTETEHYRWDAEKNEWIPKSQVSLDKVTYGYEDGVRTYTDKDGSVFFWDTEKKAWFPKIDDDFMARYQMSYGFIDNTSVATPEVVAKPTEPTKVEDVKMVDVPVGGVKRKAPPEPPKWFELDPTQNTKVYVSNLPLDITMDEFVEIMSKCGMIMRDPQTQKHKLKLYTEADGQIKGDGLCDYIKVESVDLALKLLDESVVRGSKIRVQRAKFQMRGEYNPTLKPKRKKKDKEKLLKMKEKLFDWRPEKMRGERSKHEKTVIIKNLFAPELFDREVHLIIDYQNDLREECSKCGTVRKVVVYDRHAEGVAQINMADPDEADLVVQMMNGRYFGKRKLTAEIWDGKTKYKIAETEKEVQERINKWDKYLETGEEKEEKEEKDKTPLTLEATNETKSDVVTKESVENVPPSV